MHRCVSRVRLRSIGPAPHRHKEEKAQASGGHPWRRYEYSILREERELARARVDLEGEEEEESA